MKQGMPGLAGSGSAVLVRTEAEEIRKVKHEAGNARITWGGPWEFGMHAYRALSEEPRFLGMHVLGRPWTSYPC